MQLLSTYLLAYALLIELNSAPESKLILIGTLLLLANATTLFVALYLQVSQGDRQVELALTLAESEMREAELVHEKNRCESFMRGGRDKQRPFHQTTLRCAGARTSRR